MRIDVAATPAALAPQALSGARVLVVDVLRASTTIISALAHGCAAIIPVGGPDEARRRVAALPPGSALVAGERRGETIAGFDLGNSPLEVADGRVRGKTIVFTTSNGTGALLAVRRAAAIGVAAFVNVSAAAAWALEGRVDVAIVCAGERGAVSLEDHVCAGVLVERLRREEPAAALTPAAGNAARLAVPYGKDVGALHRDSRWARHLARAGRGADVAACLALDTTTLVPVFHPDVDRIVAGPG